MNIIGLAFDSPAQPDWEYFYRNGKLDEESLLEAMTQAYTFAFHAAKELGKSELMLSPIGDAAFRPKEFTMEEFRKKFVFPAMDLAAKKYPNISSQKVFYETRDPGAPFKSYII